MNRIDILANLEVPAVLEKLYRDNKPSFKAEFNLLYPELKDNKLADYWHERLNYESADISWGSKAEILFVTIASLVAGIIAKIPAIFNLNDEKFYLRNAGFIIFPVLTAYFIWKKGISLSKIAFAGIVFLVAVIFIQLLPENPKSDTLLLSCIHLPLFLWAVLGISFVGSDIKDHHKRLDFLRYNGDLVIMTTLIIIAGVILTGITVGLFSIIGFQIQRFYFQYIAIAGLAASPIVGTYITQRNPQLVNRVSPVIAKIFSPLVLLTLMVYLVAMFFSGKNPYNDRNSLMVFNFLLIGVMAIILFSVAETSGKEKNRTASFILSALSVVTISVNVVALTAILLRISQWGITPNRLAILGANILMLTNLCTVTYRLIKSVSKKADTSKVENSISQFLPVYIGWVIIVTFIFPLVFRFS